MRPLPTPTSEGNGLPARTRAFYRRALRRLRLAGVPFLVGGAYAFARYTGIERHTKDFDVFLRRADAPRALDALAADGCQTDLVFPHWLGKAFSGDDYVDVIFSSGNAVAEVDEAWFEHAVAEEVLGLPVRLIPAEEMIWSKAFIMERERFDGADIAHLLLARGPDLDWPRLVARFGDHWRVLLSHLVLFGFIYPSERDRIPAGVVRDLTARLAAEMEEPAPGDPVCRGTILSRAQYLVDLDRHGLRDARRRPDGGMSPAEIAHWTAAIDRE
jgi:hypothetical protein